MLATQLCVRAVSGFSRTLIDQTNDRCLLPNLHSRGSLSRQLCFTTKWCPSLVCKSSGGSSEDYNDQDNLMPGGISKDTTKHQLFLQVPCTYFERVLAERHLLKEEVASNHKEIDVLTATIQSLEQDLRKLQVHHPEEIIHRVPTTLEQLEPPASNPKKAKKKRSHDEISSNLAPSGEEESSDDHPPESKRQKTDHHFYGTINAALDDK